MLFQLHYCNNYNKTYVVLTSDLLKSQSSMLFQVYCCYNRNKNYVFLTLRMSKLQYTIFYFNYITVIITIKIMYL